MNLCEKRIKYLESMITHAIIVKPNDYNYVTIGYFVSILFLEDNLQETYEVVSSLKASPSENKISNESPLGMAIYHKTVEKIVCVVTEHEKYQIKILNIKKGKL